VDPGSRVTGWAVVTQQGRQLSLVDSGQLSLVREKEVHCRLGLLLNELDAVLENHQPQVVAVEDIFTARHPRSALLLGQARGVVLAAVGQRGIPLHAYAPATVKRAVCGHGRAGKDQVQRMTQVLLSLSRLPGPDEADAMAVAICHGLCGRGAAARPDPRRGRVGR